MSENPTTFGRFRRYLHWAVAALLCVQIPLAWYMTDLPLGMPKLENYALHKSIGLILLSLGVLRLVWALLTRRPALPPATPRLERIAARVVEGLLFLFIILMPFSGWMMSSAANIPVSFFGLFSLPALTEPDEAFFKGLQAMHQAQSYILLGLIGLHFAAALRHFFLKKDNVLYSMLPLNRLRHTE